MNNVTLVGNLTRDPELRKTQSGQSVVRFTLAVSRNFKNANGETEADFINCTAWRGTADTIARYLGKGSKIGVVGRIQTGSYDDAATGKRIYTTDVIVENFEFLDTKRSQNNSGFQMDQPLPSEPFDQRPQYETSENTGIEDDFSTDNTLDIASDDLPF